MYTIVERLLDELSFDASERLGESVTVDAEYVRQRIDELCKDEDLSKFIL